MTKKAMLATCKSTTGTITPMLRVRATKTSSESKTEIRGLTITRTTSLNKTSETTTTITSALDNIVVNGNSVLVATKGTNIERCLTKTTEIEKNPEK
jgi:hypothetical protein